MQLVEPEKPGEETDQHPAGGRSDTLDEDRAPTPF